MPRTQNVKGVLSTKSISQQETVQLLTKFLNKEQARRESLDSVVYLKENITELLTRVRDSLVEDNGNGSEIKEEQTADSDL